MELKGEEELFQIEVSDDALALYAACYDAVTSMRVSENRPGGEGRFYSWCKRVTQGGDRDAAEVQDSAADWACCVALQEDYFDCKLQQTYSTVLVSALLVTITLPLCIAPPPDSSHCPDDECGNYLTFRAYNLLLGAATSSFLLSILTSVQLVQAATRPYTKVDTLVLWLNEGNILVYHASHVRRRGIPSGKCCHLLLLELRFGC
jgi:hypothetical protein